MSSIHHTDYQTLVRELKAARESAGINQVELGQRIGRDQTFVSKYETLERRLDILELRLICEAIGVSFLDFVAAVDELLKGSNRTESGEATTVVDHFANYPKLDNEWSHTNWHEFIDWLVESGLVTYKEIGSLILGHLNPSQVGTSIASKKTFQAHYPKGKIWQEVRSWHFAQTGRCADCGTRLELQADHMVPREDEGDKADRLENMTLRCRRCNVVRRPSHKKGGLTFLTAESALMWILFFRRPKTYQEYETLCRGYGLTMANIRFQEAWAMARWLEKDGLYEISSDSSY